MDTLSGSVERITFYNPENGYSVLRLKPDQPRHVPGLSRDGLATVVGNLPELSAGEYLKLSGTWSNHPKHGMQFQVEICEQTLPATVAGIRRYLGSGLIKGIGPRLAERIVARFGSETLDVIENQPARLQEVDDIGVKRSALVAQAWEQQKQVKQIMLFLHSYGISTNLAVKIYKQYGEQALTVVQHDPYRLAADIYGVGFKTADKIAQSLGLPADHPSRIEAGLVYALNEMTDDGHVYSPRPMLAERAVELLGVSADLIPAALERLRQSDRIREELLPLAETGAGETATPGTFPPLREAAAKYGPPAVYLTPLYHSETGVAERLSLVAKARPRLADDQGASPGKQIELAIQRDLQSGVESQLSAEQRRAVQTALETPLSVLTGGPGTGKTTCIRALIAALEAPRSGRPAAYGLASPTGRAAKRLAEATGRPASTIHRLLGFSPGEGFQFNVENPLPLDLLVVDEASMLDLNLANHLLKALRPGTHLLLVGDVDQLPSVGAGDVLRDVIASELAPVTRLSAIFRQAAGSQIITNAHRINQGQMPVFSAPSPPAAELQPLLPLGEGVGARRDSPLPLGEGLGVRGDFFLFPAETAEEAANWVLEVVCQRIPQKFGLHPRDEIQVLAPMYRGPVGVQALNERLQEALNPGGAMKPEKRLYGQTFRQGDKVMQTQNNYDKDVFNGDMGSVVGFDPINHLMSVIFEGRRVDYDWSEADQLVLAYAVSVHKAQGSEFPAVVMPVVTSHYMMLQRNLLYTAITRAKQLCVLVGSRKAISIAVRNDKVTRRYTALDWRLKQF